MKDGKELLRQYISQINYENYAFSYFFYASTKKQGSCLKLDKFWENGTPCMWAAFCNKKNENPLPEKKNSVQMNCSNCHLI